ncbi:ABC transporter permease [Agrobacterium vitis]|uniref:ABC transporter permease n=1 Tax=Agrobacterium vitis TaxID=373 RepID=A0AAE2RCC9_AGRVI|nr:ABC transporter permease [Agrobacterium vitis]MCF1501915.1 ABC transporter permease [Allorhizobium sp. Av2]MBF2714056.1 ABC transporter permease [Agrobacterium vitis]MCM2443385.1 ABC transporter permease [Agrobacterium vitis]MUZ61015.1 ABC transporter permease subunit [Agrobacterium vitis]MVA69290.1 ABC transporter permease subunit [Agrobacterium vitis]
MAVKTEVPTGRAARTNKLIRQLFVPLVLVALWFAATWNGTIDPIFLPSPADVWRSFLSLAPLLPQSLAASVSMTLGGFIGGSLLGLAMGLTMAYSRLAREIFGGVLDFFRPIPIFALIPLFILWFGLGKTPQIVLIVLGTSLVIGVATIEAIKNVPAVYIRAGLVLGAQRGTIYRSIILPAIFPHLLGAIRVAAASSWGLDVAAEYIGAQVGLGHLMIIRVQYLDTAGIVVIVGIYCLLAIILDKIVVALERPLTRWTEKGAGKGVVGSITGAS